MYLIHQATLFMLDHFRERLSLDREHTPEALEQYGNTVSSTIPILIHDLRRSGRLRPGKQTLLIGFGVGLSWAGCVWTETWAPAQVQSAQESSVSQPALEPVSPALPENENALAVDGASAYDKPANLSRRAGQLHDETLVSALMARALGQPNLVSLAVGFVDHETLPVEATRRAMERIWSDPALARAALQYGTTPGHRPLCEALLDRMLAADRRTAAEMNVSVDDLVLMPGSNQLLFLLGDVLFDPGDIVICAAPTYYVYLGALVNLGARAIGVESDAAGRRFPRRSRRNWPGFRPPASWTASRRSI